MWGAVVGLAALVAVGCPADGPPDATPEPSTSFAKPLDLTDALLDQLLDCMSDMRARELDPIFRRSQSLSAAQAAVSPETLAKTLRTRSASLIVLRDHQMTAAAYVHARLTVAACLELVGQTHNWEEFARTARDYRKQIPLLIGLAARTMRVGIGELPDDERQAKEVWIDKMLAWREKWMQQVAGYLEQMPRQNYELVLAYKASLDKAR